MDSVMPIPPSLWPAGRRAAEDILRIAHRGGASGVEDYRPENLRRLATLGTHLVEIDVRTTKDGSLVVHHEAGARVDGEDRRVDDHTLAELRALLPAGSLPDAGTVLAAVRDAGLGLYVDVKDVASEGAAQLVQLLAAERMTTKAILASADPGTVAAFSRTSSAIPRAVLFTGLDEDPVRLARLACANFLHPCWEREKRPDRLLSHAWLETVRAQSLGVVCWHEERPDVLASLRDLGVDGVCTDSPEVLAEVLSQ